MIGLRSEEVEMARGWKRTVEVALARAGPASLAGARNAPSTVVLAYHNIIPSGEPCVGDRSLHIDQADFSCHLDLLSELGSVVGLEDAMRPRRTHDGVPRFVVTFDDAYRGTLTAGMRELAARKLPATVFVPPGMLGASGFWWDRVATADSGLDPEVRRVALEELDGETDKVLAWAVETGREVLELPDHARPVTEGELLHLEVPDEVTFGAHTWSHPNLRSLSPDRAESEMARSREWLSSHSRRYVDWIAYPYGLHSNAVERLAAKYFEGALLVSGGLAERRGKSRSNRFAVPRVNVPRGITLDGLKLRLSGLLG
jgi:peptidoglycan/xylan/chitin deacetylase (PgdA/CDA1 family)